MTTESLTAKLAPCYKHPIPDEFVRRLASLAEVLPDYQRMELRAEADFFGASWGISRALGLSSPPCSRASWYHGFIHNLVSPSQFLWSEENTGLECHLVNTQAEADFMVREGYELTFAVGTPFIYTTISPVQRIPRSLLIAPGYAAGHDPTNLAGYLDAYLNQISQFKHHFDFILMCLKPRVITEAITQVLVKHDIPWIEGAEYFDMNALLRMRTIYSSFEVVTSNIHGTHLCQATTCGARVCVFGPEPIRDRSLILNLPAVIKEPRLADGYVQNPEFFRDRYQFLFREPHEAGLFPEWAHDCLGTPSKRPPEEVARLLGWMHCKVDPVFATSERRRFAASLGWLPSEFGDCHAVQRAVWKIKGKEVTICERLDTAQADQARCKTLAKELKEAMKSRKWLQHESDHLHTLLRSWTWRFLAKPFHSIEKRVRELIAKIRGTDA